MGHTCLLACLLAYGTPPSSLPWFVGLFVCWFVGVLVGLVGWCLVVELAELVDVVELVELVEVVELTG